MFFIRRFEETLLSLFDEGLLNGTTHACIGQEADSVGIMEHVLPADHVFSNHRCHGHYLARTGDAYGLLAEIMGKGDGLSGGLGGSQHICAPGFKSNGVLGGTLPAAAGIALAEQLKKSNNLSIAFIGDGTFGEGIAYETFNIASLWKLPLFIVVEDNGWSQSTPIDQNLAGNIPDRLMSFRIPVHEITTTDVLEVGKAASEEINQARTGNGPRALVIHTYRLCHHSKNDDARPVHEVKERWKIEPLVVHAKRLTTKDRSAIEKEVNGKLREIVSSLKKLP